MPRHDPPASGGQKQPLPSSSAAQGSLLVLKMVVSVFCWWQEENGVHPEVRGPAGFLNSRHPRCTLQPLSKTLHCACEFHTCSCVSLQLILHQPILKASLCLLPDTGSRHTHTRGAGPPSEAMAAHSMASVELLCLRRVESHMIWVNKKFMSS